MTSYKDALMKKNTDKLDKSYMIGPLTTPIECFVCKQLFHSLYQFTYSVTPCSYSHGGVKTEWSWFCLDCMNARIAEDDYKQQKKDVATHKLARMVTCVECGEKVEPEDILRNNVNLLRVCRAKCYPKVYPRGLDRTDYNKMFEEFEQGCTESAHQVEDEIYRRFICDVATGHFKSTEEMMEMAKKIKTIIDDRVDSCRWYA